MKDLLIIGAGPAGLTAGFTAAQKGLDVTIIDSKKNITDVNRACSAQFVLDPGYEGETLKVENGKLIFTENGFEVPYKGKLVPIIHNYMYSPKGHRVAFEYEDLRPSALKFDKKELLSGLLEMCNNSGVEVLCGTMAIGGKDNGENGVCVTVRGKNGEYEISAKKLIIAEGVNCKMTEHFGLNEGRKYFGTPLICSYTVVGTHDIPHNSWIQYYGNVYHPFTEIMIGESTESEDALEITVGGIPNMKPDVLFKKLVEDSPLTPNLKDATVIKKTACSVKSYLSLKKPFKGNILAIGDSSAHIEVINQGAIMCGYHAAFAIKRELDGENGFEEYSKWWNKAFVFNCDDQLGQIKMYGTINIKGTLADDEIDYVFSLLEGQRQCGNFDQYEVPKNFWKAVLEYDEKIKEEKPDLYEKLAPIRELKNSGKLNK